MDARLQNSERIIIAANSKLLAYEKVLGTLEVRTQTMLQVVFQRAIDFSSLETVNVKNKYNANNVVYGGSVIKSYSSGCKLLFSYDRGDIILEGGKEYMLRGFSGIPMHWTIKNRSQSPCSTKFQISSTPRGRSSKWSDDPSVHE
jgi:hypothetical protein